MSAANPDAERTFKIGETDYFGFTFYGDDVPSGVTISSGTVAVSPVTGFALESPDANVSVDGTGVYAFATASVAGEYDVTFTVNFTDGKTLLRVYRITVI